MRAIRWASDRIGDQGIVAFVTNGGFIEATNADGLRKSLADEFAAIYVYNLRGNQRTAGEQSKKEGGKVFGSGSRNTVAITLLIRRPEHRGRASLKYRDIGDYLSREDKLRIVDESMIDSLAWSEITPNDAGDWINQRGYEFDGFTPLAGGQPEAVFARSGPGISTNRDAYLYAATAAGARQTAESMRVAFNEGAALVQSAMGQGASADDAVSEARTTVAGRVSWSRALTSRLRRAESLPARSVPVVRGAYRPFNPQWLCLDDSMIEAFGTIARITAPELERTPTIAVTGPASGEPFAALATNLLPNLHFMNSGGVLPRWTYEKIEGDHVAQGAFEFDDAKVIDGYKRIDNITDTTLKQYRDWYGVDVTKDAVFAFVYGFLHSPDYRERFAADLKRSLPRIPRIEAGDFTAFRDAGRRLLDLHIGYEEVEPYRLTITGDQPSGPGSADRYEWFRVDKLRWAGKSKDVDKSSIVYNPHITIAGIPDEVHRYMLGSRSALEWILDRYQVKTDKDSGIVNDPNDWSREVGNPRYILDLIAKVTTVSVETVKIVETLPPLRIVELP